MYPLEYDTMNKYDFCEGLHYIAVLVKNYYNFSERDTKKIDNFFDEDYEKYINTVVLHNNNLSTNALPISIINQLFAEIKSQLVEAIGFSVSPSEEEYDFLTFVNKLEDNIAKFESDKLLHNYSMKQARLYDQISEDLNKKSIKYKNAVNLFADCNNILTNKARLTELFLSAPRDKDVDTKTAANMFATKITAQHKSLKQQLQETRESCLNTLSNYNIAIKSEILRQEAIQGGLQK